MTDITEKEFQDRYKATNAEEVSWFLWKYMQARAKHEGVGHELTQQWYAAHVTAGSMPLFGVFYDTECITKDEQQPEFYKRFMSDPEKYLTYDEDESA